jgi:hypothetical protein
MPPAPVHDMVIHPREGDLVVGTYGRGAFVTNITPLREMNRKMLSEAAYFFTPNPKGQRVEGALGNYRLYGDQLAWVPNEPNGITLTYYLKEASSGNAKISIKTPAGDEVATLQGPVQAGINRVVWSLEGRGGGFGGFRGGNSQPPPEPGSYVATIEVAGQTLTQKVAVLEPVILAP